MKKAWHNDLTKDGLDANGLGSHISEHADLMMAAFRFAYEATSVSCLNMGYTEAGFDHVTTKRLEAMDYFNTRCIERAARLGGPVQCERKCSYCCYQHVLLSCTEAFQIVRYLEAHGQATDYASNAALVGELNHLQRYQRAIACPLLKNKQCSVYEVRPMPCRSYLSTTQHLCKLGWQERWKDGTQGTNLIGVSQLENHSLLLGSDAVFLRAGYQMVTLELADAITQAGRPGAWQAWFHDKAEVFTSTEEQVAYPDVLRAAMREAYGDFDAAL